MKKNQLFGRRCPVRPGMTKSGWLILLGMLLLSGCRESLTPLPVADGLREGGRRLGSELSIVPTENAQLTKSSFTGNVAAVSNWTLFQFDAATGLLEASYYQPSSADLTKIKVVTDRVYDWYAVANVGDVRDRFVVGSTPESTLESWYATGFDMTIASGIPMSWMGKGLSFSKADLSAGRKLGVAMTRLVARYDITVDKSALTRYSFTVTGATIEGPDGVRPFAESRGTGVAVTTDVATTADVARMNSGDAATFYAAENLYGERSIANADSKKPKNIGADDHPTFIEIAGNATLLDGSGLTFGTTYRFYLGKNATTNFDVLRNTENTVTLHLTDAKIAAAIDERDVISGGGAPEDPLWKVEIDPYTDTRSLRFQHGVASGGTGIRLSSGTYTAEAIVKDPSALQYQFRLDQALYDAGVRVYRDAAGGSAVLPGSEYAEDTWVSVTDSPATLYFYIPAGVSEIVGQAHVRSLDGRKSDDLNVEADRVLDHLSLDPYKTFVVDGGSHYHYYVLTAHFTDGTSQDITERSDVTWEDSKYVRFRYGPYNSGYLFYMYSAGGSGYYGPVCFEDGKKKFVGNLRNIGNSLYNGPTYGVYPEITETVPQTLFTVYWTYNGVTKTVDERGVITRDAASMEITPSELVAYSGGKPVNLTATVTYTDGSSEDVSSSAVWGNDSAGLLTNNGNGSYTTGNLLGTTTVTASFGGVTSNPATISIVDRTPATVQLQVWNVAAGQWQTSDQTVGIGSDQSWRIHVTYTDGGDADDLTTGFTLTSSDESVLAVSGNKTHALSPGSADVSVSFGGTGGLNAIKVTVEDHAYTHELWVSNLDMAHTYAEIVADAAATLELSWDGAATFHAYHVRKDHGALDASYGNGGILDVSSQVTWTVASALTASNVGSWDDSSQCYSGHNRSGAVKTGVVSAAWNGSNASKTVSIDYYTEPYLRIREDGPLTWNCWEYGTADKKTFHIESNTSWELSGATDAWYVSKVSGSKSATITVYPVAKNTGEDISVTLTVTGRWSASLTDVIVLVQEGATGSGADKLWYSVVVAPETKTIAVGETWSRFTATLVSYSDKERNSEFMRHDISDICRYEVSDASIATVKSVTHASSTGEATGLAAGTITVTGWWLFSSSSPMTYREGVPVEVPGTATLTVASGLTSSLSAAPTSLQWTWDESGSGSGKSVTVSATNCTWSVKQISSNFGYSTSGNVITVYPKTQNTSTAADKTGTLTLQGSDGVSDVTVSLTQTKKPETPPDPASLQVSPTALTWTWDESGSSDGKTATVTAMNCTWSVKSCTSTFGYSVSGNTITVYPKAQNTSTTTDKTGKLILQGSEGVSDVTLRLTQTKKPAPELTGISFDRNHYDLVHVVDGTVSLTQSFRVTALFSDGSTADVTAAASYADQGSVSVSAASGTMTAQAACSSKVVTASYGGLTGQATYSATDLEIPVGLVGIHFESQEDQAHEFVIHAFEATLRCVLSGATRTEEVTVDVSILSGPIVRDPDVDGMLLFHFSSTGSGTIAFSHARNGVTFTCYLDVTCYDDLHIDHTWR